MQGRTDSQILAVNLKKKSSQPVVNYYKKSYEQVSEMLQRKRTQRGEQLLNNIKKQNSSKISKDGKDLRIGEGSDAQFIGKAIALTKVNKNSRPQSRKNSKKALQGITNEGIKNKIQNAMESNKEYLASVVQSTPNHHYFQGHYQKMYFKQVKQLEQQKMQNALIVRNIKTLSKISDFHEQSQIKKNETYAIHEETGDYIPHTQGPRAATLIPNSSQQELHGSTEKFFSQYTRNNYDSCEHMEKYNNDNHRMKNLEYNSAGEEQPLSPQPVKSDRHMFSEDYLTQELAIKSFTELDVEGRKTQIQQMNNFKKQHAILSNKQNSLKIDTYNKFIAMSYGAPYSYYDPLNPLLPMIYSTTANDNNIQPVQVTQDNPYPSMLSQIAKQHLIHSMHSPNKLKQKPEIVLRKAMIEQQIMDGTWLIELQQKTRPVNEIAVKGQSVPNQFVLVGGVSQTISKKKAQLQSARGQHESSHYKTSATPGKQNRGENMRQKVKLTENNSIDYRDQNQLDSHLLLIDEGLGNDNSKGEQNQQVQRPQSKYQKPVQRQILIQNQNKSKMQSTNTSNQRNSLDLRQRKHNSISETIKHIAGGGSQVQVIKDSKITEMTPQQALQVSQPLNAQEEQIKDDSTKCNNDENPLLNQGQQLNTQIISKSNYSFRPRKPLVNPVELARLEQERLIQMKHEAKEKYQQFSLQNKQNNSKLKYIVCPGNNSQIVKKCLELRKDRWEEGSDFDTLFNFKWHPVSKGIKFEMVGTHGTRQLVNHFENHDCFTTKDQMFKNLLVHCEAKKMNVFEVVPVTFLLEVDSVNYAFELEKFVAYFTYIEKLLQSKSLNMLQKDPQLMEGVLNNINNKYQNYQMSKDEKGPFFAKRKIPESHFQGHNIWILKATGFNRGRGIHVFNKLEDLKKLIKEYTDGINFDNQFNSQQQTNKLINKQITTKESSTNQPTSFSGVENVPSYLKSTSFVIQKYVEKPLLLRKRKFDIRVWVVITQDGKCFIFKEGYIRTSCEEYSTSQESINKVSVHLTNNAVQKNAENYGKFEDGNQLSFADLQNILNEENPGRPNYVKDELLVKMKDFIKLSLDSVKKKLKTGKNCCFELFGYDFIIDGDYDIWLIEVNTNPCLEESSQLLCKYMPRMVNDMLKLTLDTAFQPKKGQPNYESNSLNVFPIDGYTIEENMWEPLCLLD